MWHAALIVLHAVAGLLALVTGIVALRAGRLFDVYLWSLAGMTVFLTLAVAAGWPGFDPAQRWMFCAFLALAGFMVLFAVRARRIRPIRSKGSGRPSRAYVDHVGFTLVALFDAFLVIAVLDLGAPGWAVTATGVVVAIAGHYVLVRVKDALAPPDPAPVRPESAASDPR